jgi:hypothetical protein
VRLTYGGRPPPDHRRLPRNPFDDAVLIFKAVPGIAKLFDKLVPPEYVDGDRLRCVCGGLTVLEAGKIVACDGGCDRYFVRVRDQVWRAYLKDDE